MQCARVLRSRRKPQMLPALALCALCVLGAAAGGLPPRRAVRSSPLAVHPRSVVLDCGSTGTRAYVFELLPAGTDGWAVRPPAGSKPRKIDVPLHRLAGLSADEVWERLQPLMAWLEQWAAPGARLRALATAGVRGLDLRKRLALVRTVHEALVKHSPFVVDEVRVMSGDEEGMYGWVAANYLINATALATLRGTTGSIDVGGGSTQAVALMPKGRGPAARPNLAEVRRRLYCKSYLGFGAARMEAEARKVVRERGAVEWPCGFAGHTSYGQETTPDRGAADAPLRGTGSLAGCERLIRGILRRRPEDAPSRLPDSVLSGGVIGMSLLHHVTSFLSHTWVGLTLPRPTLREIREAAAAVCATEWAVVSRRMDGRDPGTTLKRMPGRCFDAALALSLLGADGYGFPEDGRAVTFAGDVGGAEVEWALGAAIAAELPRARGWPRAPP